MLTVSSSRPSRNWAASASASFLSNGGKRVARLTRTLLIVPFFPDASPEDGPKFFERNSECSDLNDFSTLSMSRLVSSRLSSTLPSLSAATHSGGSQVTEKDREHFRERAL